MGKTNEETEQIDVIPAKEKSKIGKVVSATGKVAGGVAMTGAAVATGVAIAGVKAGNDIKANTKDAMADGMQHVGSRLATLIAGNSADAEAIKAGLAKALKNDKKKADRIRGMGPMMRQTRSLPTGCDLDHDGIDDGLEA